MSEADGGQEVPECIKIGDHLVRSGKCFVIAEIGVAHCGRIDLAERLIDAAKGAGADAVKFQAWRTSRLLTPDSPMFRTLLPVELSEGQLRHLKEYADQRGITFLCTPDQAEDADFLDELVPAFKVGSGNLRDLAFLRHVAAKGKPILLSTGMSDIQDVDAAVRAIEQELGRDADLVLLHCVSIYPAEDALAGIPDPKPQNLRAIETLKQFGYPVGLSDHSRGRAAMAGVALGASVYEVHVRLLDGPKGLDDAVSIDSESIRWLVDEIRWTEAALGDGVKRVQEGEAATMQYVETWRRGY
jgi:N-acetylneuraminate synthase/N,N'-diacetyllegionaminate synthase